NNWPYSAAGPYSPKREQYPRYMYTAGENPRGVHAARLLKDRKDFTPAALNEAAYDSFLPAFEPLIPALVSGYDELASTNPLKQKLADQIAILRGWDYRWSLHSVATTLAALWGDALWEEAKTDPDAENISVYDWIAEHTSAQRKLAALSAVSDRLQHDFGSWRIPFGSINRYQ